MAQHDVETVSRSGMRMRATREEVDSILSRWQNGAAVESARETLEKYGMPDEVTEKRFIWHNNGPWKRTMVVDEAIPHHYPKEHTDSLYQVIPYRINRDKACDALKFDGSVLIDAVKGEIGSRCDKEKANFMTTNMAVEIMEGRRSVEDARRFMATSMLEGKNKEYMSSFQFTPMSEESARDPGRRPEL